MDFLRSLGNRDFWLLHVNFFCGSIVLRHCPRTLCMTPLIRSLHKNNESRKAESLYSQAIGFLISNIFSLDLAVKLYLLLQCHCCVK